MRETDRNGRNTTRTDRRTLLSTLGGAGVIGLAGCLGSDDTGGSDDGGEGDGGSGNEGEHMGERRAEFTFLDETYPLSEPEIYCENMNGYVAMGAHGDPDLEVRVYDDGDVFVRITFGPGLGGEQYRNNRAKGDAGDNVAFDVGDFGGNDAYEETGEGEEIWVAGTIQTEANTEDAREANPDGGDVEFNISC